MCCDTCGLIRCTCPPPPKPVYDDSHYLIDGMRVKTVREFKKTYGMTKILGVPYRTVSWETGIYNKILYKDKKSAEKELLKRIKRQIKMTEKSLQQLKKKRDGLIASTNK